MFSISDCILLSLFECTCLYCVSIPGYSSARLDQSAFLFITFLLSSADTKIMRGILIRFAWYRISIGLINITIVFLKRFNFSTTFWSSRGRVSEKVYYNFLINLYRNGTRVGMFWTFSYYFSRIPIIIIILRS